MANNHHFSCILVAKNILAVLLSRLYATGATLHPSKDLAVSLPALLQGLARSKTGSLDAFATRRLCSHLAPCGVRALPATYCRLCLLNTEALFDPKQTKSASVRTFLTPDTKAPGCAMIRSVLKKNGKPFYYSTKTRFCRG